ncbi:hypothetical protein NDU88_000145 [Pleurodeles waltl]|uniref:Uncharacterized protein n=1 Tax=Pleurodeles waltl TaxID=8319 RepID=A0AAV7Q010_PLEWA|nr:hypothetical protein NDU88_000145 [Pleurodeles waltl]
MAVATGDEHRLGSQDYESSLPEARGGLTDPSGRLDRPVACSDHSKKGRGRVPTTSPVMRSSSSDENRVGPPGARMATFAMPNPREGQRKDRALYPLFSASSVCAKGSMHEKDHRYNKNKETIQDGTRAPDTSLNPMTHCQPPRLSSLTSTSTSPPTQALSEPAKESEHANAVEGMLGRVLEELRVIKISQEEARKETYEQLNH